MIRILAFVSILWFLSIPSSYTQSINLYFGDTLYVSPNQEVWVDLRVNGFTDVSTFSFSLVYDNTRISFLEYQLSALPNIAVNVSNNLLKAAWISGNGLVQNLQDSTILLRLHFNVSGNAPSTTLIEWGSDPFPTEFFKFNGGNLSMAPVLSAAKVIVIRNCNVVLTLPDTLSYCQGDSVQITADCTNCQAIIWNNGHLGASVWASSPGLFFATASASQQCYTYDSLWVIQSPLPALYLPDSVLLCTGEQAIIVAESDANSTLFWSTGATTPFIKVTSPGTYSVIAENEGGCSTEDSVQLINKPLPFVQLPPDTMLCKGQILTVGYTSLPHTVYHWNNGTSLTTLLINQPETVILTANMGGCINEDTMNVLFKDFPFQIDLGPDIVACDTSEIVLEIPSETGFTYFWSDGSNKEALQITASDNYWVEVTYEGCTVSDTVAVELQNCQEAVFYVPNVFAPESGNVNATFGVFFADQSIVQKFEMQIYDRWGSVVFYGEDPNGFWDGTIKGMNAPVGVYIYWLRLAMENGEEVVKTGDVTLVR